MSSCLMPLIRNILVRHFAHSHCHHLTACQRLYYSTDDSSDSSALPARGQYIPQRIRKRLKDRNLSIEDLEYKTETPPAVTEKETSFNSMDLRKAVEESLVDNNDNPEFPSDLERLANNERFQGNHAYRPKKDPSTTSILLFPGQGSQFVGMGQKILPYPGVSEMFEKASEILGYDLLNICVNGPKSKLDKTVHCQPAVMVTSLAAVEKLKEDHPEVLDNCVGCAGFSVGEFSALVFSGALPFEDAVRLIKVRAECMQKASEAVPSGMLTVFCDHRTKLRTAMVAAREYCRQRLEIEEPVCRVANYLCTDCKVVAGHEEALEFLQKYGKEWGIRRTKRLPVSGAFHTPLMRQDFKENKFIKLLKETQFQEPKFPVHFNIDGKISKKTVEITRKLQKQLTEPVMWEQTLHILYSRKHGTSFPNTYEVGPAKQLGSLLKLTNAKAYENYRCVDV